VPDKEYAYFSVIGPGSHESITELLRIPPSRAWNAGDPNTRTGRAYGQMFWQLDSGLDQTQPLSNHIDTLLLILGTRTGELRSLWLENTLTLQCVGHYTSSHGLHLDREHVRQIASLGLAIDLDFYSSGP
jgi:Domain of unknown function (DUF4279)